MDKISNFSSLAYPAAPMLGISASHSQAAGNALAIAVQPPEKGDPPVRITMGADLT